MEAKDTVMSASQLDEIYVAKGRPYTTADEIYDVGEAIAKAQAEISFRAGIKEIVEQVEKFASHSLENDIIEIHLARSEG